MARLQRVLTVASILIGVLLLVGIISAFFEPDIQAALTVTNRASFTPTTLSNTGMIRPPKQSNMTPTSVPVMPTMSPAASMPSQNMLAQDTFQRGNQPFWGTASDGQRWGADANRSPAFSIAGHRGIVAGEEGTFEATIGQQVINADVVFSGSISHFGPGTSNFGAILRWTDARDWYKAYIDGAQFVLLKDVASKITVLKAMMFAAQNGTLYSLRFRAIGSMLMAKVWASNQAEPAAWMVTATDTDLPVGYGGLRIVILDGAAASITMFEETAIASQQ